MDVPAGFAGSFGPCGYREIRTGSGDAWHPTPHTDNTLRLYLLPFAPQSHAAGQEPNPGSANELVCCVFVCAQLGACGCGKQVLGGLTEGLSCGGEGGRGKIKQL